MRSERKRSPQRQSGTCKADKNRDGRTGTERGDRSKQGGYYVRRQAAETAEDPLRPLRWKIALDPRDQEDQRAKQNDDLNRVIDKKLEDPAQTGAEVNPKAGNQLASKFIQPCHTQYLALQKIPNVFGSIHTISQYIKIY